MQSPGATETGQGERARVVAALHGNHPDRPLHVGIDDAENTPGFLVFGRIAVVDQEFPVLEIGFPHCEISVE